MKINKTKKSNKITNLFKHKRVLVLIVFAGIGVLIIGNSFASTSNAVQCIKPSQDKSSVPANKSVCVAVGNSGGITYWQDKSIPNKKIHVTRVDLTNKRILFRASSFDERGKTPSQFAKDAGLIAALNGDFFYKDNNYNTNGLAIGAGKKWAFTKDTRYTSFVACTYFNDCYIENRDTESTVDPARYLNVVSGSESLITPDYEWNIKHGDPGCVNNNCDTENPRSAVALSADRKVMWMVMVEGRQTNLSGLSLYDLTKVLKNLGASWAVNLDGGGSAGMVLNNNLVNARPTNDPNERRVGNVFGFVELPPPAPQK